MADQPIRQQSACRENGPRRRGQKISEGGDVKCGAHPSCLEAGGAGSTRVNKSSRVESKPSRSPVGERSSVEGRSECFVGPAVELESGNRNRSAPTTMGYSWGRLGRAICSGTGLLPSRRFQTKTAPRSMASWWMGVSSRACRKADVGGRDWSETETEALAIRPVRV
ncbi:hypothetical protein FHL15_009237 [Xylaria flabelliformis]|uniref:Uncharacterized protein n=1 Tax=Xylaria flabelliformis TaxID=2512241 RepID=A0A553HPC0_9PEZI|nr:hypothetical protein FHL15_009237 [Xylaria flabelliformis]